MRAVVVVCVLLVTIIGLPESEAQLGMVPSSCKMNIVGCPKPKFDRKCHKCCRRAGCDRGDCDFYNCKCTGCGGMGSSLP